YKAEPAEHRPEQPASARRALAPWAQRRRSFRLAAAHKPVPPAERTDWRPEPGSSDKACRRPWSERTARASCHRPELPAERHTAPRYAGPAQWLAPDAVLLDTSCRDTSAG